MAASSDKRQIEKATIQSVKGSLSTGIQSIEVGMPLLAALADASRPLSLSELARETNMAASKAHKYLASFIRCGAVEQNQASGFYDLGPLSLRLGLSALRRVDIAEIAYGTLNALRDQLNQTISLTSWMPLGPTIIRLAESSRSINLSLRLGSVLPVLSSSSGPLFAAYLDRAQTRKLIDDELAHPSKTLSRLKIATINDVELFLGKVRQRGFMHSEETVIPGVIGLSAPVFDHQGIVATLSIIAVKAALDLSFRGNAAHALLQHASQLSERLGGTTGFP